MAIQALAAAAADSSVNISIIGNLGVIGYGLAAIGPGIGVGIVWAAYITPPRASPSRPV